MLNFKILVVEHGFIKDRWPDVDSFVKHEFQDSNFNDGFTVDRPFWHIQKGLDGKLGPGIKHVLALDPEETILAAAFCIPTHKGDGENSCDIGWFLSSSELSRVQKVRVLDQVFDKVHEVTKAAGFQEIVTNMGTQEGAKYLGKRQGYIHQPNKEKANRWVKTLQEN